MTGFKFFLLAFLMMNFTMIDFADAQVRRRGPRYNPPGHHRPIPLPRYEVPRPRRPLPAPQARISCSSVDNGWEEHRIGHPTCGACLREHGNCVETCSELRQVCEVRGIDYAGRTQTYRAIGVNRLRAESKARSKCEWDRDNRSCMTISCHAENRMISRRDCR